MNSRIARKAVSWECMSNLVCFALAYMMFGHIGECLVFTVVCVVLKIVGYYLHGKWWEI